jgi:hypothetical protein
MSNKAINWARRQEGIGSSAKFLLWVIADWFRETDGEFVAWPSYEQIKADTSLSERTIRRAVEELQSAGLVVTSHRRDGDGRMMGVWYYLPLFDARSVPPVNMAAGDHDDEFGPYFRPGNGRKHRPGNGRKEDGESSSADSTTGHPDRSPAVNLSRIRDTVTGGSSINPYPLLVPLRPPHGDGRSLEHSIGEIFHKEPLESLPDVNLPRRSANAAAWEFEEVDAHE